MNQSIVAIATILSLGTVGCASGSTLYDGATPASRAASLQHTGGGLGALWEPASTQSAGLQQRVAWKEVGGDLWTPASVARTSEVDPAKADPKTPLASTVTKLKF